MPKCVLAFSGSLDTLVMIPWLKEHRDLDVVTLSVNLGGETDLEELGEQALLAGAVSARIEDVRDAFFRDFISPSLRALAHYESYLLAAALARPLIARELVRVALEEGASCVAHGSTLKGNDQVRFESAISTLAPKLNVIMPHREWNLRTRDQRVKAARLKRLRLPAGRQSDYKYDFNLWGQSIKCEAFADPSKAIPEDAYTMTQNAVSAPNEPEQVQIEFLEGVPVGLDGRRMAPVQMLEDLNRAAGRHGIGRADLIEDRLVGFKSHEVYEAPAATVFYIAKRALESLTLSRETLQVREGLAVAYGRCVYNGQWFSDLREALDGFYNRINQNVTGKVTLRLYKGNATVVARESEFSLYSAETALSESVEDSPAESKGFSKLFTLPLTAEARRKKGG
ncbi:MAG: argininosuccinate synthase [Planctomycetota bacterium]|nr:argininosuccinate synthase [Planctomycetota bacterium]